MLIKISKYYLNFIWNEFISSGTKGIYGIQPHPEKSQDVGLKFFKNLFIIYETSKKNNLNVK